jgi:hypothetical protein
MQPVQKSLSGKSPMAIVEPILAFTLSRLSEKNDPEQDAAPLRDDESGPQTATMAVEIADVSEPYAGLRESNFDYAGMPAENVAEIDSLILRIRASRRRHVEAVHDVGADLLRAKELLGHGNFLPWLQAEFRWSERTANNYMAIARFFRGKTANFADLDIGAASALAAKSTPPDIRDELLERAEAGENISREEVKMRIAAGKKARRLAQEAARQAALSEASATDPDDEPFAPFVTKSRADLDDLVWSPPALPEICSGAPLEGAETTLATSDAGARTIIEAMLRIEGPMERICSGSPGEAANMLMAAANEQELTKMQKIIGLIIEIKRSLDDHDGIETIEMKGSDIFQPGRRPMATGMKAEFAS